MRSETQSDAERRRDSAIERNEEAARRAGSRFTVMTTAHELGEWWVDNVASHRMRPSSVGTVAKRLTRDRQGRLAYVRVVDLSSEQVQEWQSGPSGEPTRCRTRRHRPPLRPPLHEHDGCYVPVTRRTGQRHRPTSSRNPSSSDGGVTDRDEASFAIDKE